ncbi:MAG: hypothetical protein FH753_14875 [Firmicutes bacterium]|nr:hypothetical protein [Bacillota bacterium]
MGENEIAILLFGVASVFSIVYASYEYISLILYKDKIKYTTATVMDIETVVPETMKKSNSKWAYVRFWVNGKQYISSKRIQVSMNISVGDEMRVGYLKNDPSVIFTSNWKKADVSLAIGILCVIIIVILKGEIT